MRIVKSMQKPFVLLFLFCLLPLGALAQNIVKGTVNDKSGEPVIGGTLVEESKVIDEVVVVGYGVQKKSDFTGAVASVKADDIKGLSTTDAGAALQGKAAAVQIINSGGPGEAADSTMKKRRQMTRKTVL